MPDQIWQNLFGFFSGLIGAGVGGWFTLYAAKITIRQAAEAENRQDAKEIQNLLDALGVELGTLWTLHAQRIGAIVAELTDGEPFLYYYPLSQDYFTIYNANAACIGKIQDASLREAIVVTYNKCKKVVDGFNYNNTLFNDWRALIQRSDDSAGDKAEIEAKFKELCAFGGRIRADHLELKAYVDRLLPLLKYEPSPEFMAGIA